MKLLRQVAQHPVSVLMAFAAVLTFGAVSLSRLEVELLPTLHIPVARVITVYPDIPAEEVERLVTVPLENSLSSVKGVKELDSVTTDGLSAVALRFDWRTDVQRAAVAVREKVDAAYPFLPFGIRKPLVFTEDANDLPLVTLAVYPAPGRTLEEASRLVRGELSTRLRQIAGVASVRAVGQTEEEVQVQVDGQKLHAAGLPLQAVERAVAAAVCDLPVGTLVEGERQYLVKVASGVSSLESVRAVPLATAPGSLITVGDLAEVRRGTRERTSFFHAGGREAVGLFLYKTPGVGTLNACRSIRRGVQRLGRSFQAEVHLELLADSAQEIESAARGLLLAMALGSLAALGVLLLLLRRPGFALITVSSIPLSVAAVFLVMDLAGITLNVISLAGMAIGIGLIVDNSIVVLDNLQRRRAACPEEIAAATAEMISATFGSTLTTLLVFLPVVFVPGVVGALFTELAVTVSSLLLVSFLLSLTFVPATYSLLLRRPGRPARPVGPPAGPAGGALRPAEGASRAVRRFYRRYLLAAFRHPLLVLPVLGILLGVGLWSWHSLPRRVVPRREPAALQALVRFPEALSFQGALSRSLEIARRFQALPGVGTVFAQAGFDAACIQERGRQGRRPQVVEYTVLPAPRPDASGNAVARALSSTLAALPGVVYTVSPPQDSVSRLLGVAETLRFRLTGQDRERLTERAVELARSLRAGEAGGAATAVELDTRRETPLLELRLDREALAYADLSSAHVLETLSTAVRGATATVINSGAEDVGVRVRLRPEQAASVEELGRIRVAAEAGALEIGSLGTLVPGLTYPELFRHDRKAAITLTVLPAPGRRAELEARLAKRPQGSGFQGELLSASRLRAAQRDILLVFALAVLLIYMLLGAQFESLLLPLLLLLCLPLSVAGSLAFLRVWGYSLNINSFLGMLILLGTVVNAAILLSASYGAPNPGRVIRVSLRRLRPIAATTATTLAAMLPIALDRRGQAVLQSNTAVAMIGGLAAGTAAILLVFPVLYCRLQRRRSGT